MLRYLAPLVVLGILIAVFIKGLSPDRNLNELPSPFLDKAAPRFDLPKLRDLNERVASADYDGQVAIVNFWATWCVGCRQEHAFLMELSGQNVVPIYGVDWRDRREPALAWLQQLGNPYVASGFDEDATTGIDWGVYGAPETFLIGKDGRLLHKHLGPLDRSVWDRDFAPIIANENGETR